MFGRTLRTLMVLTAALILPRLAAAQAVDVPLGVVIPIEFDPSADVDRPQTVSLPLDFERQTQIKHVRSLLDRGERVVAVRQLGRLLNRCDRDTLVKNGGDLVGFRRQVTQLILQLPPAAHEMYVAEFEPPAAAALESAHNSSAISFVEVANRFPGTPSGRRALLLQTIIEIDRGRKPMAIEYLRRLQDQSPDRTLPANALSLVSACQLDRAESVAAGEHRPSADHRRWHGRHHSSLDSPAQQTSPASVLSLLETSWSEPLTVNRETVDDLLFDERQRIAAGVPAIPATRPLLTGGVLIIPIDGRLVVFDVGENTRRYSIKLDRPHSLHFAQDGVGEFLAADDGQVLVVQRYRSNRRSTPNQFAKQVQKLEPLVFPVWPPDNYMNTPIPIISSRVVTYDLQTGIERWSSGGLDATIDGLRDATICGTPVIDNHEVFVIAEAKSTLSLIVLDADDGRLLWTQQLGWADRTISDDLDRLATDCRPLVDDDLIVCPTSAGKLVAVNRSSHSLQWAFEYRTSALMPFEHHLVANTNETTGGGWLGSQLQRAGNRIVVAAPDSSQLLCIDRETGRQRWSQPQNHAWYVAHVDNRHVWTVGARSVQQHDIRDGTLVEKPITVSSVVTGIGVMHGGDYLLPTVDQLVRFDLKAARQIGRMRRKSTGALGNLASAGSWLIDASVTGVNVYHTEQ